jgi:hypothetical protein
MQVRGRINIIYYSQQPGKIICQVAKEDKCSLIVIGCRDAIPGGSSRTRKYSETVDYVLKKADCPVVVARRKTPLSLETRSRSGSQSQTQGAEGAQRPKAEEKVAETTFSYYGLGRRASIA